MALYYYRGELLDVDCDENDHAFTEKLDHAYLKALGCTIVWWDGLGNSREEGAEYFGAP